MYDVEDPLKPLDQINLPDARTASFVGTLEDRHRALATLTLPNSVPADVRQLFETAKNLRLYTHFVYRFHPVAELVALTALEEGLKTRVATLNSPTSKPKPPSLGALLRVAKDQGWFSADGFPRIREEIRTQIATVRAVEAMRKSGAVSAPVVELTDEELDAALQAVDLVGLFSERARTIRNALAHGTPRLAPTSLATLTDVHAALTQVFPDSR